MRKQVRESLIWLIVLLVIFVGAWKLISNFYHTQVLSQQEQYLEKKGEMLIRMSDEGTDLNLLKKLSESYVEQSDERITLLDKDGRILYDTFDPKLAGTRSDRPEVKTVLAGGKLGVEVRKSDTLDKELLYVALPVKKDNKLIEILRVSESTSVFMRHAETVKRSILLVYLILCGLITALVLYFVHQKNRPLETMLPVLKKMVKNPQQTETILQTSPQWQELYQTINQLSEQMSQTYQAYEATENQLHTLLNELMIGVFILDSELNLVMMNPAMQEQLGIFKPLEKETNFAEVIKDTQLIQLIYRINDKQPAIHEIITSDDPVEKVLDINLRLFNEQQQILGISYDLTRIHQLEKMQQDFVGNVSHELKTPVTSLIGFTETLLDGAKDDPAILTEFLTIMQKDAKRLEKLIHEILQLSKGKALDYPAQQFQIHDILDQLVNSYQSLAQNKDLTIAIDGPVEASWQTKLELFYPIVKNLLENAIQYSNNGTVRIAYQVSDYLELSVTDQGIGIDMDDQTRIFERFYRVDKARSRHSGGTGLGLAIVKDYTEQLGGTIEVASHPGVGTTFTLKLPKDSFKK